MQKTKHQKIEFQGREFLFIKAVGFGKTSAAIFEPDVFENYGPPSMRLDSDGNIRRFGQVVGSLNDVTFID